MALISYFGLLSQLLARRAWSERLAYTSPSLMQHAVSPAAVRTDLERLKGASLGGVDASPFRTAVRNIIAACRNSPLALAAYCREGVLPHLANALGQVRDA